jgi:hypothetical protein
VGGFAFYTHKQGQKSRNNNKKFGFNQNKPQQQYQNFGNRPNGGNFVQKIG